MGNDVRTSAAARQARLPSAISPQQCCCGYDAESSADDPEVEGEFSKASTTNWAVNRGDNAGEGLRGVFVQDAPPFPMHKSTMGGASDTRCLEGATRKNRPSADGGTKDPHDSLLFSGGGTPSAATDC